MTNPHRDPADSARRLSTLRRLVIGSRDASYALYQTCNGSAAEVTIAMDSYEKLCGAFANAHDLTRLEVAELLDGEVR